MDADLEALSREQLILEVIRLRRGIREHRDSSGHDLCWHHPGLWSLLPEKIAPAVAVPAWPQFLRGCIRYRQSLDEQVPEAPRVNTDSRVAMRGRSHDRTPAATPETGTSAERRALMKPYAVMAHYNRWANARL